MNTMANATRVVATISCCVFSYIVSACWIQDSGASALKETRHGDTHLEILIPAEGFSKVYLVVECQNTSVNFFINWQERVGQKGKKRRHLFYSYDGDKHIMLPVLDERGLITGYKNESLKAKALASEILRTLPPGIFYVGVFPAGRDPVTGEWIDVSFSSNVFEESVLKVSKHCQWDLKEWLQKVHEVDWVPPGGGQDDDD
jgi:hypothetical protein